PVVRVDQDHGRDVMFGQVEHVALIAEQAATVVHDRNAPLSIDLQTHTVSDVVTDLDLLLTTFDDICLRGDAFAVSNKAAPQFHAEITHHVPDIAPRAARRAQRDYSVVNRHLSGSGMTIHIPGVR